MKWITWREKLQVLEECWSLITVAFQQGFHCTIALTKSVNVLFILLYQTSGSHINLPFAVQSLQKSSASKTPLRLQRGDCWQKSQRCSAWIIPRLGSCSVSVSLGNLFSFWKRGNGEMQHMQMYIKCVGTEEPNDWDHQYNSNKPKFSGSASSSVPNSWPNLPCKTDCLRCLMDLSHINYYKGSSYKKYCYSVNTQKNF